MQGSGSKLQDQRSRETKIKTKQNHHSLYSKEKQQAEREANNAEPSIMSLLSANKADCEITVSGQRGSADPAGLQQGLTWWMWPLSQQHITKEHRLPSNSSLLAFAKFFNNCLPCTPSHPHCEKLLIEERKKTSATPQQ